MRGVLRASVIVSALAVMASAAGANQATTCITPTMRCSASLPGPPGSACQCLGESGPVNGVLG